VITVRDRSAMVIEGTEALESIIQGVNSVHSTTVTVGNVDITPLDYEISVTGALVTVDGDVATQTLGLQPGNTRGHTVQTTCDDTAAARTGTLTVRSLTDPEDVYSFLIAFSCTTLEFSPPRLDVKGSVDGEIYTEFQAVSRMAVGSQWVLEGIRNNAPADVTVVDSIAIEAFGTFDMSSLVECKAAGSGTALATFIPDPFTTSARDPVHLFIDITCQDRRGGGLSWGDPHLETFDRVRYDFQAVGEYVLARSPGFEVQARQEGSGGVSRNTAIAVGVDSDRIAFYGTAPEGGGRVMENGSAVTITDRTTLELAGGGVVRRYGDDYTVEAPDGTYARVSHRGRYLRVTVQPVDGLAGTFEGLLGDFDGDPANDFALRDGTPLGSPPSFLELYDCSVGRCLAYDDPGGWLIRDAAESLFDYSPGEGPGTFIPATQYPIEPVDLTQFSDAVRSWASAQCVAAGILDPVLLDACVLDLVVTGDVEMGTDAAVIEDQEAPPVGLEVCDGVDNDQNGEVDENDVCACTAAEFQGTTYQFCGAKVPWLTARSACLARGLDLGRIGDPAENAWVFDHLATLPGSEDRWMGLTDLATEDVWLWTDGSPVVWSSWGADQPSNSNDTEHCGQFVAGFGDWNDLPCEWEVAFFCE
ncbi:MAG: VWD domain-containing protein, partial [Acidobacteriota bacterium]